MQQAQQQIDLQGQLRENDKIIPFRITQTGPIIRYTFTNPDEVLQLRLEENGSRLDLVKENGTEKFASSRLDQKIRETGVSYGDLALKFLYWPNARVAGEDAVRPETRAADRPGIAFLALVDVAVLELVEFEL